MSERKPAEVFDPRDFVREEMTVRTMTLRDLPVSVREWMGSRRTLDLMVAQALSALFGTSSEFWLNLDASWRANT